MSTYTLEHAKSARSKCTKCKTKIEKGELRILYRNEDGNKVFSNSTKLECFKLPRKYKDLTMEEFVTEIVIDETEDKILDDPSQLKDIVETLSRAPVKKKKETNVQDLTMDESSGEGKNFVHSAKRCAALMADDDNEDGEEDDNPPKKKGKLSAEDKAMGEAYIKFNSMKSEELKDILSWNNVVKTGTKDVLLTRIIDGYLHGRIAKCFLCGKGRPKISDDGSHIACSGYYDEKKGIRLPCAMRSKVKDVKRLPWFHQEPTEEEIEAMKKEDEVDESNDKIPEELMKAAKKLDWDLSSKKSMQKAAKEMFKLCTAESSPIDFPTDLNKVKIEIIQMILKNKKDALGVLEVIIEKYGMKENNAAMAEKKSSQIASLVEVGENAAIFEALAELSALYFKAGNSNAGITYQKVSKAIQTIDYEITKDNAKGLGKGKTKVAGIGKGSADKIYEFITTGTIQKLEEKRAEVA